jgi:hypothetical protein
VFVKSSGLSKLPSLRSTEVNNSKKIWSETLQVKAAAEKRKIMIACYIIFNVFSFKIY